jgi:hypothetical protein
MNRALRSIAGIAAAASMASTAAQQQDGAPSPPAKAPCTTEQAPYRDFDFWVGDWDVFDPDSGRKLGENTITLRENGCLIVERWRSVGGATGMSMNFYDPLEGAWRQVWQSAAGFIDYAGGLDDEGRMVLEGTLHYNGRGEAVDFRGRWTPNDDGTVLQEFWQRDAESGEWSNWFVGEYRPR